MRFFSLQQDPTALWVNNERTNQPTNQLTNLLLYFMVESPSWEANSSSAMHEIPYIL